MQICRSNCCVAVCCSAQIVGVAQGEFVHPLYATHMCVNLQVSFAEYRLFYRALLQKRPLILKRPVILSIYWILYARCICLFCIFIVYCYYVYLSYPSCGIIVVCKIIVGVQICLFMMHVYYVNTHPLVLLIEITHPQIYVIVYTTSP